MKKFFLAACCGVLLVVGVGSALAAPPASSNSWQVAQRYRFGGSGGWDYVALDQATQRLYVSRSDRVLVLDANDGKQVGQIDGLSGVHGIAIANTLQRGFISNGHSDNVTVFDPVAQVRANRCG